MALTSAQLDAIKQSSQGVVLSNMTPASQDSTSTTTPPADSSTPSIASQVTPTPSSSPATGTTGTTASSGGVLGAMVNNAVPHATVGAVTVPTPISTQLNQAATNPQISQISNQWKPNPTNDPAIAASNDALHQQALQIAKQNGLVYDPGTGTYSQAQTQQDGSLHLNVNGKSGSDIPVYQGHSFDSASDIAKQLGLDFKQDPKTGEVTIGGQKVNPISYTNGMPNISTTQLANALGLTVGYDDKTKTVTIMGKDATKTPIDTGTGQQTSNGYNSPIQSIAQGMPQQQQMTPWTPPDLSGFQQSMIPYQQFNPNIDNFYQQAHNQLDPQFNANNQKLADKQNLDIQKSDESMNRRGIYSSGVAQAAEDDLRAKTTNALAAGFTAQMAQIEKTAQTLFNTAYKQYQDGNQFALKNNQDQVTNMLNTEKQSFSEWAQTQKLDQSQYNYALKAWDQMAGMIMKDAQNQMNNSHFNQTMDFNQYKFDHPSAAQQLPYQYQTANNQANNATSAANNAADNQTKANIALLPYQQMTQYQQATTQEKQQMDAAINYFKQQGINIDQAKLMESIRHNQAGEANANNSLLLRTYEAFGYGPDGKTPTLSRETLNNTIAHDQALIQDAQSAQKDTQNKTSIDALGKELTSINSQINDIYNNPPATNDPNFNDQSAKNAQSIKDLGVRRDNLVTDLSKFAQSANIATQPQNGTNPTN